MTERPAAVVIGAGVIGSAVAFELARSGYDVTVVDKGPAIGAGSTSASAAIIRFNYSTRAGVLASWEAAQMWRAWPEHLGVRDPDGMAEFVRCPQLVFCTDGYDAAHVLGVWSDCGIPFEELDAGDVRARFPWIDNGRFFPPKTIDDPAFAQDAVGELAAIYQPDSGFMNDPILAARNLAHAARLHGATFRLRTEVVAIETDGRGDRTSVTGVSLADGTTIAAPVVVNVAGPHSSIINRMVGADRDMTIRTRPLHQEVMLAPSPPGGGSLEAGAPVIADLDVGQYVKPQPGGVTLFGAVEAPCDPMIWVDDPDTHSDLPTQDHWETAMMRAARRFPEFGVPRSMNGVAALYDAADDWTPIYDRSAIDGFFMACGTSGNQFKNAPIAGQFLRAIVDASLDGHDHDAEPLEFVGPTTGLGIDLATFSRRRTPKATTGTVLG